MHFLKFLWFYSILAGWSTWQWVFLNFSQNFWSFDTPDTPRCVSAVIWNRFDPFLLQWQLANKLFDHINKIYNQNSHILKMRLILRLITFAAIISYCSISALNFINKCYKCTDPEKNVQSSMEHKWLCYSITFIWPSFKKINWHVWHLDW